MPTWSDIPKDTPENMINEIQKRLAWITARLDSKNVKRLDTNETTIKSKNGETYINGPIIEMRDSATTLRLKQGYDSASNLFLYSLYNALGVKTFDVDSNGNGVFTGSILSSIITGGTIRTAASGQRLEITSNGLTNYNSSSQKEGVCIEYDSGYSGVLLYHAGAKDLFLGHIGSVGVITPVDTDLCIGDYWGTVGAVTYAYGNWDFQNATLANIVTDSAGSHSHSIYIYNAGQHNHGILNGTVLQAANGGTVTWIESGDHIHTYDVDSAGTHSHNVQ